MHRRNQNGRRSVDSGQGSSAEGAFAASGFGVPGLTGEWISLSKRWIPPDGIASMMKFAPLGVGMLGIAVAGVLRGLLVEVVLPVSDESGTDTVNIFFRLDEEKFFRSMPGPAELLLLSRAGDSGIE